MAETEWTRFPYADELEIPAMQLPVRYAVPYDWGSVRITEAAHQAYGVAPLLTDDALLDPSDTSLGGKNEHAAAIWLVGPDEAETAIEAHLSPQVDGLRTVVAAQLYKNGVGLIVKFDQDAETLKQNMTATLESKADTSAENMFMVDDKGAIPVPEFLEQTSAQAFAHTFAKRVTTPLAEAVYAHQQMGLRQEVLKDRRRSAATVVLGGGLMVAGAVGGIPPFENPLFDLTVLFGATTASAVKNHQLLKSYLTQADEIEFNWHGSSAVFAQVVSHDIEQTFSAEQFNRQAERMRGSEPG